MDIFEAMLFHYRKLLKIGKVLQTPGREFIDPQVRQADEIHSFAVQFHFNPLSIAFVKIHAGGGGHNFNQVRLSSNPNDAVIF